MKHESEEYKILGQCWWGTINSLEPGVVALSVVAKAWVMRLSRISISSILVKRSDLGLALA